MSRISLYPTESHPRHFCFISPLRHRLSCVGVGIALPCLGVALPWCRCLVGVGVRGEMLVVLVKHMGKDSPNKRKTGWLRMTDHATCDPVQYLPFFGCRYTAPLIQRTHESNQITAPSPLHSAKLTNETAVQTVGDEGAVRLSVARRRKPSSEGQSGTNGRAR